MQRFDNNSVIMRWRKNSKHGMYILSVANTLHATRTKLKAELLRRDNKVGES